MGTRCHLQYEVPCRQQIVRSYWETSVIRKLQNRDPEKESGIFSLRKGMHYRSWWQLPSIPAEQWTWLWDPRAWSRSSDCYRYYKKAEFSINPKKNFQRVHVSNNRRGTPGQGSPRSIARDARPAVPRRSSRVSHTLPKVCDDAQRTLFMPFSHATWLALSLPLRITFSISSLRRFPWPPSLPHRRLCTFPQFSRPSSVLPVHTSLKKDTCNPALCISRLGPCTAAPWGQSPSSFPCLQCLPAIWCVAGSQIITELASEWREISAILRELA